MQDRRDLWDGCVEDNGNLFTAVTSSERKLQLSVYAGTVRRRQGALGSITCTQSGRSRGSGGTFGLGGGVYLCYRQSTAVEMEPLEEYQSPFDFEQGVNTSYLYLSPAYSDTPPSSPATKTRGKKKKAVAEEGWCSWHRDKGWWG